ncbi:GAF and ANTAR domain-containing protein [Pseudarthrobacter sp. L1SW]|uniref:GAF and ANTAR domain-containing protein n=1 Tax=Pseudarthrobacter sp. L1SW TaxID=2851598 RepID=UPI001E28E23B|nr:GAF and ANTAR domain-containing protein [Pseudarthrobacter sp. L1SW]UEL28841.1 GAF and ANTAR domain-containing protein [Pseudarthrobacter sp. L1SW]
MEATTRAERVSGAFVKLTDTLVADYDVLDLLHTLVEEAVGLLDIAAAGLVLADPSGELQVLASTSEESRLVEVLQLRAGEGPCVESFAAGKAVTADDIRVLDRWPAFKAAALSQGFHSVHAVPMRLHGRTIGAMGLFRSAPGSLSPEDAAIGQALADVATISLLQERAIREAAVVNEQLQRALNSRVLIEQAKGVIAHTSGVDMEGAFRLLRKHARAHNEALHETAGRIVDRSLTL